MGIETLKKENSQLTLDGGLAAKPLRLAPSFGDVGVCEAS